MSNPTISYQQSGYCELPARLDLVADSSALLKQFCQTHCLDETLWPQIDLAFCECMNNAIEHGCLEDPDKRVRARWTWHDKQLTLEVEDPGSFEPSPAQAELPEDPTDESGRGSYIIRTLVSSFTNEATEYGHKATLVFDTHPTSDILIKTEEMYTLTQNLSSDLNLAYAERDIIAGLARDLTVCPAIETFVDQSIKRINGIIELVHANVWTLLPDGSMENVYHYGDDPLSIPAALIGANQACACTTVLASEREMMIEDCSLLSHKDPLFCESGGCAIVIPIVYQRDCIGTIALHAPAAVRDTFFTTILPLTKTFAHFLALAYTSFRTFRQREEQERSITQLEVAAEIQRSLLPSTYPKNHHCSATGRCDAAMVVGGDYIDAIEVRDAGILFVIADVMGKGVPAALLATIFRTAIRSRLSLAETPGWLLSKINKQIHEELGHLNMFITAQAAFFSYEKKILKLASAGHCPALHHNMATGETELLESEGLPLGILPSDLYEEKLVELSPDSRVLFITDGLYERENHDGDLLGLDALVAGLSNIWEEGLDTVPDRTFAMASNFAAGRAPTDDQTLMALEVH